MKKILLFSGIILGMIILSNLVLALVGSISITPITIPSSVSVGDGFTITVPVSGSQASDVTGSLTLPTSGLSCTPTGSQTISLDAGGTGTASWSCTADVAGDYTNQILASVTATDSGTGAALSDDEKTGLNVLSPASLITSSTISSTSVTAGGSVTFIVGVNNAGDESTTYSISLTCPTGSTCSPSSVASNSIDGNTLENNAITVTGSTVGSYTITATVTGNSQTLTTSKTLTVTSSGNGGNGGGGGGGGGTTYNTYSVNSSQLAAGYIKELAKKDRFKFTLENKTHYAILVKLTNTTATINVTSETQQVTLSIGDLKKFELTNDSYYDLSVKLISINSTTSKANLTVKSIHEKMPVAVCTAGEKQCKDKELQQCKSDGSTWEKIEDCVWGCDSEKLECKPRPAGAICTPDEKRCENNDLQQCSEDGKEWTTLETCVHGCDSEKLECKKESVKVESPEYIWYIVALIIIVIAALVVYFKKIKKKKK